MNSVPLRIPINKPHMACNFLNRLLCMACNFLSNLLRMAYNFHRLWFRGDVTSIHLPSRLLYFLNRWLRRAYWEKKLGSHLYGQFSMVVALANLCNCDRSQLVSGSLTDRANGPRGVFVGIYDGHGIEGATCSQFVIDHLFKNFKSAMQNHDAVNPEVIQEAYHRTDVAFVDHVRANWRYQPRLAYMGSYCLVGVVSNNVLYVANAGHSRAVLARWTNGGDLNDLVVIELSVDQNKNDPENTTIAGVFTEFWHYMRSHEVTRAIGDVYLKYDEFNQPFRTRVGPYWVYDIFDGRPRPGYIELEPIVLPHVMAKPMIAAYQLSPNDRFVIFARRGSGI